MSITKAPFGRLPSGQVVCVYTLESARGMSVRIIDFGGRVVSMRTPDKDGRISDVVFGFDSIEDYYYADGYQGAIIGRTCNRIGNAKFNLDGVDYELYKNDGENALHGGKTGFDHKVFSVEPKTEGERDILTLRLLSPDGDENYPGNLSVKVMYILEGTRFTIHYEAQTDKKTIVNMTNHSYFNLGGYASGPILSHVLQLDADSINEIGDGLIPTGRILPVAGTPFDFTSPKQIGRDIDADDAQLKMGGGYDHNFILRPADGLRFAARLGEKTTGRIMTVYTDAPCVQLYTSNMMHGKRPFKGGLPQTPRTAVCLETQKMPDSINHEGFTNTVLDAGETYETTTVYEFSAVQ